MFSVVIGCREEGPKNQLAYELQDNDSYSLVDWVDEVSGWEASLAKHNPDFVVLSARRDVETAVGAKLMLLIEQLQSAYPQTKIVIATDYEDPAIISRFYELGARAVIPLLSGDYLTAFNEVQASGTSRHPNYPPPPPSSEKSRSEKYAFIQERLEGKTALLNTARLLQRGVPFEEILGFLGVEEPTLYQYRWRLKKHLDLSEDTDVREYLEDVRHPI
jgi:DNA-binding NarL/FixJ family response regulator